MNHNLASAGSHIAIKQQKVALIVTLTCITFSYFIWGKAHAISAAIGGFIAILPNVIFAYKAFKYAGAASTKLVMKSFFSGIKIKMATSALLFSLTYKFLSVLPVPFFGTFCLVMLMSLLTPFLFKLYSLE